MGIDMANEITNAFRNTFRDFVTDGVPSTGEHEVWKQDARNIGPLIQDAVDLAIESAEVRAETWPALAANPGSITGQPGEVPNTDAGTHVDPVTGETVTNSGLYAWSVSPAGWQWLAPFDDGHDEMREAISTEAFFREAPDAVEAARWVPPNFVYDATSGISIVATRDVLFVIPFTGQSLANGDSGPTAVPGAAIATTPLYRGRALMPSAGVRVSNGERSPELVDAFETTTTPVYGNATETVITSMLSGLVALCDGVTGAARPRFCGFVSAQGGTAYRQLKRGSQVYHRIMTAIEDAVAYAKANNMRVIVPGVGLIHGENHTGDGTTREGYFQILRQWIRDLGDDILPMTGQTQRPLLFLSQTGTVTTGGSLDQAIQQAQFDAGQTDWGRLVGPNYHLPRATNETIHLSSAGENRLGQDFARAIFAELNGQGWRPVAPTNVRVTSPTTIQIDCSVRVSPLVIDTTTISPSGLPAGNNNGFDVQLPDGTFATISSVAVSGNTSIILTLASPLSVPSVRVGYALRRNTGTEDGPVLGARGCVRDSYSAASPWESHTLRNWMIMWTRVVDVPAWDGAWTAYTPTPVWTGGTPTGATIATSFKRVGKSLHYRYALYTGTALNGATALTVSLPPGVTAIAGQSQYIMGANVGTGEVTYLKAAGGATVLNAYFATGGLVADRYFQGVGVIEIQ